MAFKSIITVAAICLAAVSTNTQAALVNSYDFNNSLTDTLGNGLDLIASGGVVSGGRYGFSVNQGLRLVSALPSTTDYGIEIKMQINDSTGGFNKVIDFQDLASDIGLYIQSGGVDFFTVGPVAGSVLLDVDFTLGLARSGSTIEVFLDNVLLFSVADSNQAVSAANILNFFEDDNNTGQIEAFAGSVDFIRIHDDASTFGATPSAVPVPAAFWLFGSGLLGLVGLARRKA